MSRFKLHNLFGIAIAALSLVAFPLKTLASTNAPKTTQVSKERLVLMPLRLGDEDRNLQGAMESALAQGLQQKFEVFSGDKVSQKAKEIFSKESRSSHKECDETRCMQGIAEAFQAELIATANVTKRVDGYFLAISIQNIFDNKLIFSNSLPCKNCDAYQVVDMLKELSGGSVQSDSQAASSAVGSAQEHEQQLAKLVSRIREMLAPDSLTVTRAGLASELYAEAARISPNDLRVKAASAQIGEAYLRLAIARADDKDYREADNLINKGLEFSPENRQLIALHKDVAERQKQKHQTFGGF